MWSMATVMVVRTCIYESDSNTYIHINHAFNQFYIFFEICLYLFLIIFKTLIERLTVLKCSVWHKYQFIFIILT